MKNENLKVTENANATEIVEATVETTEVVESSTTEEVVQLPIYVERIPIHSNGKKIFNYCVKSKMHGKEIKADLLAGDLGGYEILDLAFGNEKKKLLGIERATRADALGKAVRYNTYYIEGEDEIGIKFKVTVKPRETSDKTYLEYIIAKEQKLLELKG